MTEKGLPNPCLAGIHQSGQFPQQPGAAHHGEKVSLQELDLDVIPEFRPRQGTDVSINDSGYATSLSTSLQDSSFSYEQYPYPHPPQCYQAPQPTQFVPSIPMSVPPPINPSQFYLYSPVNNTLIPCEEILVGKTVTSPGGSVYQGETKAYVAYPVHGPEGRGYITQPFASPVNTASGSEESQKHEDVEAKEVETKETCMTMEKVEEVNNDLKEVETKDKRRINEEAAGMSINQPRVEQVYIPGLVTSPSVKKVKKRRKKKPKTKSEAVVSKQSHSSSDSESKELNPDSQSKKDTFEDDLFNFAEEPINEINLTDDLANSLLNPPTEDDELETSITRDILNIVDTGEDALPEEETMNVEGNEVPIIEELYQTQVNVEIQANDETKSTEIETLNEIVKPTETRNLSDEINLGTNLETKSKKRKSKKKSAKDSKKNPQTLKPTTIKEDDLQIDVSQVTVEEECLGVQELEPQDELVEVVDTTTEDAPVVQEKEDVGAKKSIDCTQDQEVHHEPPGVKGEEVVEVVKISEVNNSSINKKKQRKRGARDNSGTNNQPVRRVLVIDDQVLLSLHLSRISNLHLSLLFFSGLYSPSCFNLS